MKVFIRLVCVIGVVGGLAAGGVAAAPPAGNGPTSATGMFVIGNGNAIVGASVTFWGAQWRKLNSVGNGEAPPAFKGYALNVVPHCGGFTTDPGNSPPPPDGPLPTFVKVLVTDGVSKSGQTISGSVTDIAVVQIDPGYDANPGHAGTGTVVALLGCGNE